MFNVMSRRIGLTPGRWPVAIHEPEGVSSIQSGICLVGNLPGIFRNLFVKTDPIHLAVLASDKTIQGCVQEYN